MRSHTTGLLFLLVLMACQPAAEEIQDIPPTVWYKGNTHAHTVICGHADTPPDSVARWYLARGYHFLILSEHNHFIDPDSVVLPADRRSDFILVPGEEVTGRLAIHTTGMNVQEYVEGQPESQPGETKTAMMQQHTDSIIRAGGLPILNHPNFVSGAQAADIFGVKRLHLFELYNGHPLVYNWGNDIHIPVEAKWDSLLTAGMLILGVSSDDAHQFQEWGTEVSNPGRGWVMVDSQGELTADAITAAMARGQFYATNGVMLSTIMHDADHYMLAIDTVQTLQELSSPFVIGKKEASGKTGFEIEFIGENGAILYTTAELTYDFPIDYSGSYVRAKVRYTRQLTDGQYESFFAWTQPRFLDDRAQMLDNNEVWMHDHDHDHPHTH